MASSFNTSSLNLADIICSSRNKEMEISLFLKKNNIEILTLNEPWLKSNFKLDIPNYVIMRNDKPRRQGGEVAILVRHNINFGIIDTCSNLDTDNEALTITHNEAPTIMLKDSQFPTSSSIVYIPSGSTISTTLLSNIKKSADNVFISGYLNSKYLDFNCTKMDKWGNALRKAL